MNKWYTKTRKESKHINNRPLADLSLDYLHKHQPSLEIDVISKQIELSKHLIIIWTLTKPPSAGSKN